MNVQIFLLLLSCVLGEPGEPPAEAAKVAAEETNSAVDVETEKAGETVTEQPAGVNITVTPEAELKNSTEETIDSIVLPEAGSAAKEHSSSLAIFFLLFVLILCIFLIHLLLRIKFHYLPESLAIGENYWKLHFDKIIYVLLSIPWSCCGHVHDGPSRGGDQEDGGLLPHHVLPGAAATNHL